VSTAVRVVPFGDAAVFVELEQRVDPRIVARARAIADAWEDEGRGPATPAYASAVLRFDPLRLAPGEALDRARELAALAGDTRIPTAAASLVEVPTHYDGPDLVDVAERSRLTVDEVVAAHTSREYTAFFLGFMPGLAYCGTLDPQLVAPRLASPRARVPAGSVAIAEGQTTIYPLDSPGGWRLIGRTDLRLFDAGREPPVLIAAGDRVRFVAR